MKIMKLQSWLQAWGQRCRCEKIELGHQSSLAPVVQAFHPGVLSMQWQTPAATDMRFGFEITMYVANR